MIGVVLVFQLTGRGLAVSGPGVFEVTPVLLIGSTAGVVIDRFDRKAVLISASAALIARIPIPPHVGMVLEPSTQPVRSNLQDARSTPLC